MVVCPFNPATGENSAELSQAIRDRVRLIEEEAG
jgi:hypothetical protein